MSVNLVSFLSKQQPAPPQSKDNTVNYRFHLDGPENFWFYKFRFHINQPFKGVGERDGTAEIGINKHQSAHKQKSHFKGKIAYKSNDRVENHRHKNGSYYLHGNDLLVDT